jgi:hypothetical protein
MAADTGKADNRGREAKNLLDVFNGNDLAEVVGLMLFGDLPAHSARKEPRDFIKKVERPFPLGQVVRRSKKRLMKSLLLSSLRRSSESLRASRYHFFPSPC